MEYCRLLIVSTVRGQFFSHVQWVVHFQKWSGSTVLIVTTTNIETGTPGAGRQGSQARPIVVEYMEMGCLLRGWKQSFVVDNVVERSDYGSVINSGASCIGSSLLTGLGWVTAREHRGGSAWFPR